MQHTHHVHLPESMQRPPAARAAGAPPRNLQEVLTRLCGAGGDGGEVSLGEMLDAVGRRSFGPLLLVCGIIVIWPISIPGIATVIALLVLLIAAQLLLRRQYFWLPQWLLKRRMKQQTLRKVARFMMPVARVVDRVVHPRLTRFTSDAWARVVAVFCILIALAMPPLELLPFSNSLMGVPLALFALALLAQDGLLVLLGLAICASAAVAFALMLL